MVENYCIYVTQLDDSTVKITFYNHLGSSAIDYALVYKSLLNVVKDFEVLNFNEWSGHAPICFTLETDNSMSETGKVGQSESLYYSSYRWNPEKVDEMKNCLL